MVNTRATGQRVMQGQQRINIPSVFYVVIQASNNKNRRIIPFRRDFITILVWFLFDNIERILRASSLCF